MKWKEVVNIPYKKTRHPTRKRSKKPTHSPSYISLGKPERKMLRYLKENQNLRFNLKAYSRRTGIPRTTIYDLLHRLEKKQFIKKESANAKITEKGKIALDVGVGASREECRTKANLSTHFHKFKLPIKDKDLFNEDKLKLLNPIETTRNRLHNLYQIILKFEDATIFVNPKQLIIHLYDIITKDVDESDLKTVSRAIEYTKQFMDIGIITEGMIIEEGHWARVESALSNFIYKKVDEKYFLDLGQGRKFWIDHSNKREDETNDKQVRERLDTFLSDVIDSDYIMSDMTKLTQALGFITKLESTRLKLEMERRKEMKKLIPKEKPDYFG